MLIQVIIIFYLKFSARLVASLMFRQNTKLPICTELFAKLMTSSFNHKKISRNQQNLFCCEAIREEQCTLLMSPGNRKYIQKCLGAQTIIMLLSSALNKDTTKCYPTLVASSFNHKRIQGRDQDLFTKDDRNITNHKARMRQQDWTGDDYYRLLQN